MDENGYIKIIGRIKVKFSFKPSTLFSCNLRLINLIRVVFFFLQGLDNSWRREHLSNGN